MPLDYRLKFTYTFIPHGLYHGSANSFWKGSCSTFLCVCVWGGGVSGHFISVAITQLCLWRTKAATANTYLNKHGYIQIQLVSKNRWKLGFGPWGLLILVLTEHLKVITDNEVHSLFPPEYGVLLGPCLLVWPIPLSSPTRPVTSWRCLRWGQTQVPSNKWHFYSEFSL